MRQSSEPANSRHAFSLIEILVAIVVIAILLAIAIPTLLNARKSSRSLRSAANVRSLVQVIHLYSNDSKDGLPVFIPGQFYPTFDRQALANLPHWQIANSWTGVVFDYLPYYQNVDVLLSPGSERRSDPSRLWPTSYHYSNSFVGVPELWVPGAAPDPSYMQGRKLSATAFPSSKAMLWDQEAAFARDLRRSEATGDLLIQTPIATADSAVRTLKPADATAPVANVFSPPGASMRLHNTPLGQLGRDF